MPVPDLSSTALQNKIPTTSKFFTLQDWDWFNGRNFCRDRCMDLVSFDTKGEYEMFAEIMARGKYYNIVQTNTMQSQLCLLYYLVNLLCQRHLVLDLIQN